jgi:hypothetical protein
VSSYISALFLEESTRNCNDSGMSVDFEIHQFQIDQYIYIYRYISVAPADQIKQVCDGDEFRKADLGDFTTSYDNTSFLATGVFNQENLEELNLSYDNTCRSNNHNDACGENGGRRSQVHKR